VYNCSSVKNNTIIHLKETSKKVIIKCSLEDNIIYEIKIPSKLEIKNQSLLSLSFIMINYKYKDSLSNWANRNIELYKTNGENIERISNNKKKTIPSNESLNGLFYTRHFVDSTKVIQQLFEPYVEQMLKKNKDTLHIGTVKEFKQKHKELLNRLTKNDSLSIQFLDGKKVTVPVEW